MPINFYSFSIRGIDTSQYNFDTITPDFEKALAEGVSFIVIRTSYGQVQDKKFKISWEKAKGKMLRLTYHYLDYYSHYLYNLKLDDVQWGQRQAQFSHSLTEADNDDTIDFLDIEKSSYGPKIEDDIYRVRRIASAYLSERDHLNGKRNGLYLSLSLVKYFLAFKDRPLWLALYNKNYSVGQVLTMVRNLGWVGPIYFWQYASDGDANADGIGDGKKFGTQYEFLDLNLFLGTKEEFKALGKISGSAPTPDPVPDPITPPLPETPSTPKTKEVEVGLTKVEGQNLRSSPYGTILSGPKLRAGIEVPILGYDKDSYGNEWALLGYQQWAAVKIGTITFIEKLTR